MAKLHKLLNEFIDAMQLWLSYSETDQKQKAEDAARTVLIACNRLVAMLSALLDDVN